MLFHRSGFNYINKKKSNADKIIKGYKNYCADLIESTYLSYRIRNRLKPIRDLISNKKKNNFKICFSIQNKINIKKFINTKYLNRNSKYKISIKFKRFFKR